MRTAALAITATLIGSALAAPASAAWREARSRHFIIYSEQSERELEAYAKRLETFDAVVRKMLAMSDPEPNPGTRLTVYVVGSVNDVQRLVNDRDGQIAGFYIPRASGSLAVVPSDGTSGGANALKSDTIFFHEYTHHMMLQGADKPYPYWLVEGYAEFLGTVRFNKEGSLDLGRAPAHRLYELARGTKLTYDRLLANEPIKNSDPTSTSIYGRSWIMAHYFLMSGERKGQLGVYLDGLAAGKSGRVAAEQAFGSLKKLNGEFESHYRKPALPTVKVPVAGFPTPAVTIRTLNAGEAAIMPSHIQSSVGVSKVVGARVLADARRIAAQYPNEVKVQVSLAEAELDMRNFAAAISAAERALAIDPKSTDALVFKGRALSEDPARKGNAEAFKQARAAFAAANKLSTEDPEPLKYYWESYRRQGIKPTAIASQGLHYAASLVPQDMGVRMLSAMQYLRDGQGAEARARLVPLAYKPDEGTGATKAQEMIAKIDARDIAGALAIVDEMMKKAEEAEAKASAA